MGRSFKALIVILVLFGWVSLILSSLAQHGLLAAHDAKPDDLIIETKTITVNGTETFVLEWSLKETYVQRLRRSRDAVFLMYPLMITGPASSRSFLDEERVNITLKTDSEAVSLSEMPFHMEYLPVSGYLSFRVVLRSIAYPLPERSNSGRIELPLIPTGPSGCSEIPVIFAYFHDTGGREVTPAESSLKLTLRPGPEYPFFGNGSAESVFLINGTELVHRAFWDERGGWLRVEVFNVTLPCESG